MNEPVAANFDVRAWVASLLGCDARQLDSREGGHQERDRSEVHKYWLGPKVAASVTLTANRRNLGGQDRRLLILTSHRGTDYHDLAPGLQVVW